jgi:hypothetical protein
MLHLRLGDNPEWALICARERLEFTDPPCSPPARRWPHLSSVRMAFGIAAVATIVAILPGDSTVDNSVSTAARLSWHSNGQLHAGVGSADSGRQQGFQPNPAHHSINHGSRQERTMS